MSPDWSDVLGQIQRETAAGQARAQQAVDTVRRHYLAELHKYTKRNAIAYYSGWLSKPGLLQTEIVDEDKNGFMMAVHGMDRSLGLDLILHTPGGSIGATQSIVDYLHQMFGSNIRAIVPQIAMSAGTIVACSCRSILMAKHSNLGPIDPHLDGMPAYGVIEEFRRACREVKRDPHKIPIWQAIIGQYEPTLLGRCDSAIKWSNQFVGDELQAHMLKGERGAANKSAKIVKALAASGGPHERHIHYAECKQIGLNVEKLEDDQILQDLVSTVHHCYMHAMQNTRAFKMIENHLGKAHVKSQALVSA